MPAAPFLDNHSKQPMRFGQIRLLPCPHRHRTHPAARGPSIVADLRPTTPRREVADLRPTTSRRGRSCGPSHLRRQPVDDARNLVSSRRDRLSQRLIIERHTKPGGCGFGPICMQGRPGWSEPRQWVDGNRYLDCVAFNAKVVRVFIASPGDTRSEREAIQARLLEWNTVRAEREECVLHPVRWETHAVPLMGASPQDVINAQLVDDADIVVAVFDSRLGSATREAVSGSAEEVERARAKSKPVHVYFSAEGLPRNVDVDQLSALRSYRRSLEERSLLGSYKSPKDLADQVIKALEHDLLTLAKPASPREFWLSRTEATPSMQTDMLTACDLAFLGISNSSLAGYLHETIKAAQEQQRILPWRAVQVYFADDDQGAAWEGSEFSDNRTNAILEIWGVLRSAAIDSPQKLGSATLPFLKRVSFRVCSGRSYFNGSLFRAPQDYLVAEDEFPVIYVVFNIPTPQANAKDSATLRLHSKTRDLVARQYHETYSKAYETVSGSSLRLLDRSPHDIWDMSAGAWFNFESNALLPGTNHSIYVESMIRLAKFSCVMPDDYLIDIGCGTGQASIALARLVTEGELTLVDSSPEMIRKAKMLFDEQFPGRVRCIPMDIVHGLELVRPKQGFDKAITHLSLQWIINRSFSLQSFARVLGGALRPDGEVTIALHNTALMDSQFAYPPNWVDPLRESLKEKARERGYLLTNEPTSTVFTQPQIRTAFERSGFKQVAKGRVSLPRTMADRLLLWGVPAVLSSIVRDALDGPQISELLDAVRRDVEDLPTPDTKVLLVKFRKGSKSS